MALEYGGMVTRCLLWLRHGAKCRQRKGGIRHEQQALAPCHGAKRRQRTTEGRHEQTTYWCNDVMISGEGYCLFLLSDPVQ